ncbi:MAG TPA: hypothetical protein VIM58_03990, partial [Candidatus Methylacidiphilales bacterium]
MKRNTTGKGGTSMRMAAAVAVWALLGGLSLPAATIVWSGSSTTSGNWSTGANWAGTAPGSADIADFTGAGANGWGGASSPIVVDTPSQALSSAFFDTNAGSYTIGTTGGNAFQLTNAGSIQIRSGIVGTVTETVNAPLVLGSGTGAIGYSFVNASTNAATTLVIGGQISGGTTGTATLTLDGVNTGNNVVSGNLVNGNSASFAVLKKGVGTWTLAGTGNTYTSASAATATTIADGTLRLGANNALSSGGLTIYETTAGTAATFDLNGYNQTLSSLTFGATSTTAVAGATYRVTGAGSTLTLNGNVGFTSGTNAATGATISVDTLDLGGAARSFTTLTGFSIAVSSVVQNGTLTKTGTGLLT